MIFLMKALYNPLDALDAHRMCTSYAQDCALMKMVFDIATEGGDAHSSTDALEARGCYGCQWSYALDCVVRFNPSFHTSS